MRGAGVGLLLATGEVLLTSGEALPATGEVLLTDGIPDLYQMLHTTHFQEWPNLKPKLK